MGYFKPLRPASVGGENGEKNQGRILISESFLSWTDVSSAPTLSSVEQTRAAVTQGESLNMVRLQPLIPEGWVCVCRE